MEPKIPENVYPILKARYLRPGETPLEMFERVARAVSQAELLFGPASKAREWEEKFFEVMVNL